MTRCIKVQKYMQAIIIHTWASTSANMQMQSNLVEKKKLNKKTKVFWRHLWSTIEQAHGNMESIC